MMSEKYLAGFIDADGYLSVRTRVGARPDLELGLAQRAYHAEPLLYAQELFGGNIREKFGGEHLELSMRGRIARKAFERLKKYMVLKRDHAERFLELVDSSFVLHTKDDVQRVREEVKRIRGYGATSQPNYPARKWMAGYLDGDGSFASKVCKKTGYAYPFVTVLAASNCLVGVTLLQKAFGGAIHGKGQNAIWQLSLSQPSKAKEVLDYCGEYMVVKANQARFLAGCAAGGNFRDGTNIRETLIALNAQQHRLSDSDVSKLVASVNFNIPKRLQGRPVGVKETRPRRKRQSKPTNVR